ncbi:hypothetical protein BKA70DRAFT_1220240 [Coprinopsis sp. MPI-PUGE-AT-0042]|nr:hypothetical protein BKA70DRAFT_1220240 [Coprinopsis sp. MPI-PUGE-AT-0042]
MTGRQMGQSTGITTAWGTVGYKNSPFTPVAFIHATLSEFRVKHTTLPVWPMAIGGSVAMDPSRTPEDESARLHRTLNAQRIPSPLNMPQGTSSSWFQRDKSKESRAEKELWFTAERAPCGWFVQRTEAYGVILLSSLPLSRFPGTRNIEVWDVVTFAVLCSSDPQIVLISYQLQQPLKGVSRKPKNQISPFRVTFRHSIIVWLHADIDHLLLAVLAPQRSKRVGFLASMGANQQLRFNSYQLHCDLRLFAPGFMLLTPFPGTQKIEFAFGICFSSDLRHRFLEHPKRPRGYRGGTPGLWILSILRRALTILFLSLSNQYSEHDLIYRFYLVYFNSNVNPDHPGLEALSLRTSKVSILKMKSYRRKHFRQYGVIVCKHSLRISVATSESIALALEEVCSQGRRTVAKPSDTPLTIESDRYKTWEVTLSPPMYTDSQKWSFHALSNNSMIYYHFSFAAYQQGLHPQEEDEEQEGEDTINGARRLG